MESLSVDSTKLFSLQLHSMYEKSWENPCVFKNLSSFSDNIKIGAV